MEAKVEFHLELQASSPDKLASARKMAQQGNFVICAYNIVFDLLRK